MMPIKTPYEPLVGKGFIKFYRAIMNKKPGRRKRQIKADKELNEIHDAIWKTISDSFVEVEGGVYIDGIGYFCHVMNPKRKWRISNITGAPIRSRTNGYKFNHLVLDVANSSKYYYLYKNINYELIEELKQKTPGKRYKFRLREVKSYINCNKRRKILSLYK